MAATLILAGGGKMGGAMLEGWLAHGTAPGDVSVVEPDPATASALSGKFGVKTVSTAEDLPPDLSPDVVVFAVKPQVMDSVVPAYRRFARKQTLFLSIAAGITSGFFLARLGDDAAVVRCMPNLPASVHRGITGAFPAAAVSDDQRRLAESLLEAVGEVAWVEDEDMMDAVTAVSGSGPAYVFLLAECLAAAGTEAGLPPDLSQRLARATVTGAGELLSRSTEDAGTLRGNVTSPGGTTAAALEVLRAGNGLQPLMTRAVAAAAQRSRELAVE